MPKFSTNGKRKSTTVDARTDMTHTGRSGKRQKLKVVVREFYNRDPRIVAAELLGKVLVREERGKRIAGRIVETEAYLGADDPAAHSAAGKTPRNAVLFGPPGLAYVYFIYGVHYCFNVSCLPDGEAGGVLVRALEPIIGIADMASARGVELSDPPRTSELRKVASGPGRLAEALDIDRVRDNGKDVTNAKSDLWIGSDGYRPEAIIEGPRVGITKAVEHPLRYMIADNPFVSAMRLVTSVR
jgi:DNA-3-methyladenine glycosylase